MSPPTGQTLSAAEAHRPRLYLVRHASPTVRPEVPGAAWHLSPEGRAAADTLAKEPHWAGMTVIHTSSEPKAVGTAQRIAAQHSLSIRIDDALHEVGGRTWAGEGYAEQARRYLAGDLLKGWEPAGTALVRVRDCIDDILARHEGTEVALVSHGLVLTLYLADLLGMDAGASYSVWSGIRLPDLAIIDLGVRRVVRPFGRA